ncbi:MAG: hypothetical protein QOJ42_2363, partial [Acidobacteriaceae bacterium]|nr:hypothetical protein [Acidobacteriaceae bacterium]
MSVYLQSAAAYTAIGAANYMKPNRREFTLMGAGSVVSALSAPSVLSALSIDAAATPSTDATETPWYRRIKRIGQTNFNEKDPLYGNVEKWVDYWASAKVEAVALSVSGPV